jgi:hypothetical protein
MFDDTGNVHFVFFTTVDKTMTALDLGSAQTLSSIKLVQIQHLAFGGNGTLAILDRESGLSLLHFHYED